MFSCAPFLKVPSTDGASPRRRSCAGLRLSKNFSPSSPLFSLPSFLPKAGAKVQPFPEPASTFFNYFYSFLYLTGFQREKSFIRRKTWGFAHLIIYNNASPTGQKCILDMIYCWLSIIENDENGPSCCGFSFSNRNEPNSAEDFGFFGLVRFEVFPALDSSHVMPTLTCAAAGICGCGSILHRDINTRHCISGCGRIVFSGLYPHSYFKPLRKTKQSKKRKTT